MSPEKKLAIAAAIAGTIILALILLKVIPKRLKRDKFTDKWRELQAFCRDKATWNQAMIAADKLLDEALKKRKFKGKTMGERLVSARVQFTDNDAVWFAHGLVKKILVDSERNLKEIEIKQALVGFRQALRDLGALPPSAAAQNDEEAKDTT